MSSDNSHNVYFGVQPGVISAFYFILFDLVLLAILDIVLSRVVCHMYYRRIQVGIPVDVRSTDIPGVTTFLVGKIWALPNVIALSVKLGFLACILLIDLKIDSETFTPKEQRSARAYYAYDPSDKTWNPRNMYRNVSRRWEAVRNCRVVEGSNVTYYALVFNLRDGVDLKSEITTKEDKDNLVELDDHSLFCLRKGAVEEGDEKVLAKVVGCSTELQPKQECSQKETRTKESTWIPSVILSPNVSVVEEGTGEITYAMFRMTGEEAKETFTEYENPEVFCASTQFGVQFNRVVKYACVLVSKRRDKRTVVERWQFDPLTQRFWREFAGPVFEGHLDFGDFQKMNLLRNIIRLPDWIGLSSTLVADSCVYTREERTFTVLGPEQVSTKVPIYAIVLAAVMVVVAIASRIYVAFTIGRDERPQINTIDGLSSIAREECEPTGRSYYGGRGMTIGLSHRDGRVLHFGPLRTRDESVPRSAGFVIE